MNRLKEKLGTGNICLGTHISLNDPVVTELIGNVGFDYLWIDTEHTAIDLHSLEQHLMAARAAQVSAIVRVPCVDQVRVKPVLEMGPDGVVFPQVNSYALAKAAVEACMYPPKGNRGFGPRMAIQFGRIPLDQYYQTVDDNLLRILQIENMLLALRLHVLLFLMMLPELVSGIVKELHECDRQRVRCQFA